MDKPCQGFLLKENDDWSFLPGCTLRSIHTPLHLPRLKKPFMNDIRKVSTTKVTYPSASFLNYSPSLLSGIKLCEMSLPK
eukprot:6000996-Ditylum_brightwellii.AAC.1